MSASFSATSTAPRVSSSRCAGSSCRSDLLVPVAQGLPGCVLDDGLLVVVSGETADGVQAGEERDGGEHDFLRRADTVRHGARRDQTDVTWPGAAAGQEAGGS